MNTHGATVNRGEIVSMYAGLYGGNNAVQSVIWRDVVPIFS